MKMSEETYSYPEVLQLTEKMRKAEEEKERLELSLDQEQFRLEHLKLKEQMASVHQEFYFPILIPAVMTAVLVALVIAAISLRAQTAEITKMIQQGEEFMPSGGPGVALLSCVLALVFGGFFTVRMWISTIRVGKQKGYFGKSKDASTFPEQEKECRQNIAKYQTQIADLEETITMLSGKRKAMLSGQEAPIPAQGDGTWNRFRQDERQVVFTGEQKAEMCRSLESKIKRLTADYEEIDRNIQKVSQEMLWIKNGYDIFKSHVVYALVIWFAILVFGLILPGYVGTFLSIFAALYFLVALLYFYHRGKTDVVDYLIEQDSPFVKSYAFEHDVIPKEVKKKELVAERNRLLTQKERYEKELQFYKGL